MLVFQVVWPKRNGRASGSTPLRSAAIWEPSEVFQSGREAQGLGGPVPLGPPGVEEAAGALEALGALGALGILVALGSLGALGTLGALAAI